MAELPGRTFRRLFSTPAVGSLAYRASFENGSAYADDRRVTLLTVTGSSVEAQVRGTSSYDVRLWAEDDEPAFQCSCPVGQSGRFCKHAVAVALVVTGATEEAGLSAQNAVDLREYLHRLDHHALVDLLLERAAADDLFEGRLRMAAARATDGSPPVDVFRTAIDNAFFVDGYVSYRDMYDYVWGIDSVIDSVQALLDDGHPGTAMVLTEYALDRAEEVANFVDGSDGQLTDVAERLQDLHLRACLAERPDPVALAGTLFDRERHSGDLDVFHGAAATYAEALGQVGLAEYRRRAQAEWDAVPPLGPNEEGTWSSERFRITTIMESLAALSGDTDQVVDVLSRDQSSAYQFVRIAEALRGSQRHSDALAWAERGLALHGGSDSRLIAVAAEEYHRAGRGGDAVRITWDAFSQSPTLRTYQHLAENAERIGELPAWRGRALELLRSRIASAARPRSAHAHVSPGQPRAAVGSTLVEVLLFDGDIEQAWVEAGRSGCRNDLWLELARRRENDHPLDAIPIWQAEVERCINAKNNHSYAEAVEYIARVGHLMDAAGRSADFAPYRTKVRMTHKAKRNLMKLFATQGW